MMDKATKMEEGQAPEESRLTTEQAEELLNNEPKKSWEVQGWNPALMEQWMNDPVEGPQFRKYCEDHGFQLAQEATPPALDLTNLGEVMGDAVGKAIAAANLPVAQPAASGKIPDDYEPVQFPEPAFATINGQEAQIPLYPINLAGQDYALSGQYKPEIAKHLLTEIEGAELIEVPQQAAFVQHAFVRPGEKGPERIVEGFRGFVFAWKTLADSLKRQIAGLVEFEMPSGAIPGTPTKYDDIITNGIRFVTGHKYLVPKVAKADMIRRIKEHEECFQNLAKERTSFRGDIELLAQEAVARKAQGLKPEDVVDQVPVGNLR
jgi:hypothetical protein